MKDVAYTNKQFNTSKASEIGGSYSFCLRSTFGALFLFLAFATTAQIETEKTWVAESVESVVNTQTIDKKVSTNDTIIQIENSPEVNSEASATDSIDNNYQPFNFSAHLKNMHVWHGFVVQPGPMFATSMEYNTRNKKFTFGFWGGASFYGSDVWNETTQEYVAANYKEFSIYAVYRFNERFYTELVTHNNFTGVEERGDKLEYWTYDRETSYNFPDLNFGYNFDNFSLYWGVILFGQSRDIEIGDEGKITNSWTQYAEVKATLYEKKDIKLTGFVGGAWSTQTEKTFYTEGRGNVINVGTTLRNSIKINEYKLPVEVTAMWNPEKEITVLQLDIILF